MIINFASDYYSSAATVILYYIKGATDRCYWCLGTEFKSRLKCVVKPCRELVIKTVFLLSILDINTSLSERNCLIGYW